MTDAEYLQSKNILPLAMKHYERPQCTTLVEFEEDFNRFKYIKKLLNRNDGDVRLLLNHIVVLYNVFERNICTKMLFAYVDTCKWSKLKTVLTYLNLMPDTITELTIIDSNLPIDILTVEELRKI